MLIILLGIMNIMAIITIIKVLIDIDDRSNNNESLLRLVNSKLDSLKKIKNKK